MEMLVIGHDGHHSISLTNSPNGGLHARHLPLQRALVALLLLAGLAACAQDRPALNGFTTWFGDRCANGYAFSNASYFSHLGNGVRSWNHSCYSSAFRFSDDSRRITAPLNSISKLRSNPLIVVLRSLPSTCLLPGCGQWTALRQAGPSRSRQKPFLVNLISIAALAQYMRYSRMRESRKRCF